MRKIYLTLLVTCIINLANAQQTQPKSSHYKAAEEMVQSIGIEKVVDNTISQMLEIQIKQVPLMDTKKDQLLTFFKKYMSWEALKEDYIQIYLSEFSEKELKDMTAFYKTPTGKKLAEKLPALMSKGSELGQKRVQEHMDELMELFKQ